MDYNMDKTFGMTTWLQGWELITWVNPTVSRFSKSWIDEVLKCLLKVAETEAIMRLKIDEIAKEAVYLLWLTI